MIVRSARSEDAQAAIEVLRCSISELCFPDHGSDPEILSGWLANKTSADFEVWLESTQSVIVVAQDETANMLGVGAANTSGEITLNYVHPDARFTGVSTAILAWLERWLLERDVSRVALQSTRTAHAFYLSRGYRDDGPAQPWRGTATVQLMYKKLI